MEGLDSKNILNIYKNSMIFRRIPGSLDKDWYGQIAIGVINWLIIISIGYLAIDAMV